MIQLSIEELIKAVNGKVLGNVHTDYSRVIGGIATDSRKMLSNGAFIALKGEKADGHSFLRAVARMGYIVAVVEKEEPLDVWAYRSGFVQLKVDSTYAAVGALGRYIRQKSNVSVVGVTGSVGKTSVKELVSSVLLQQFKVLKTEGNYNNELGLPQTLFRLEPQHEIAVLEMGISHFGEMDRLSKIAAPDIAVFTNIENVHTEYLGDRAGVLEAKTELVPNMRGNTLIMNGDDAKLRSYIPPDNKEALYYGLSEDCIITAKDIEYNGVENTAFTLCVPNCEIRVTLPALGEHMVRNSLAAAAVGYKLGLTPSQIKNGLEGYATVGSRMRVIKTGGITILDDCYNASPASVHAALKVLALAASRRIALLGDMLELGDNSTALHYEVGVEAAKAGVAVLVAVGRYSHELAEGASKLGAEVIVADAVPNAIEKLLEIIEEGDTLLIKASRGLKLDGAARAVEEKWR